MSIARAIPMASDPARWVPYCGAAPHPGEWMAKWNFDPILLLALALGIVAWRYRSGPPERARTMAFGAAIGAAVFLFVSPLCALSSALFAVRTVHHALLVAVVAPLLAWAVAPEKLPGSRSLTGWTALQAVVIWAWHIPALYSAALSSDAIYWLMQGSLLASACLFWAAIRQASVPAAVAALLASMVQMGLLGALLTFASAPLYAPHWLTIQAWGLSPLEDQQLAGLIMWAPAAAFYLAAALLIAGRWLRAEARPAA